jgi:ATP-dependent RNA helicase DOB1
LLNIYNPKSPAVYNPQTEQVIRNAPKIGEIDMSRLPEELARVFAEIVSLRRNVTRDGWVISQELKGSIEMLRTLATNLETIAVVYPNHEKKESVAFVSATAQYLLMQIDSIKTRGIRNSEDFTFDSISSGISAVLLFLIGNSPADAAEVASKLDFTLSTNKVEEVLFSFIISLATGKLTRITEINVPSTIIDADPTETALNILWENIAHGIQQLALRLLGKYRMSNFDHFQHVINLSVYSEKESEQKSIIAGPFHLARLLKSLEGDLIRRGIVNIPPPSGTDEALWSSILTSLAAERPYLWDNHYEAIQRNFLESGISSVLTFPTGAGKSTLSELKIAATYLKGQSVVYLVPTHALEDQIKDALLNLFGGSFLITGVTLGSEFTEVDENVPKIAVMTPERCLTLISVDPNEFNRVGLVVFDEFHLIHGYDNRAERRNIDAMLCLLTLFNIASKADYLLISAMVENGKEISEWVSQVLERTCVNFDSSWKPTRQIHGCVIFRDDEIATLQQQLRKEKQITTLKSASASFKRTIKATPYNYFSLRNVWNSKSENDYYITEALQHKVSLGVNKFWGLSSNRNAIAAEIAAHFALLGIKVLVFVDTPVVANSTQKTISEKLTEITTDVTVFEGLYHRNITSLGIELGDIKYSYFSRDGKVGIHHGNMLPLERRLNEAYFKRKDGIYVVVATPTLAQGINLPAEVVIIAGDDRFDEVTNRRSQVAAHEILNAAGRAGRAGMAAQGVVLLIPGEVVTIKGNTISDRWWTLKDQVFSKSDQCLKIEDPIEYFLDSVQNDSIPLNDDQTNIILRLEPHTDNSDTTTRIFRKSLTAFRHANENKVEDFNFKLSKLVERRNALDNVPLRPQWAFNVSNKTGLDITLVREMGESITIDLEPRLDTLTVADYIHWLLDWISQEETRFNKLFTKFSTRSHISKALGLNIEKDSTTEIIKKFKDIEDLLKLFVTGHDYLTIDQKIPGKTDPYLSKARNFILKLVPDLSFVFGVISLIMRERWLQEGKDPKSLPYLLRILASCIKEGVDNIEKLDIRHKNNAISRVECHLQFNAMFSS